MIAGCNKADSFSMRWWHKGKRQQSGGRDGAARNGEPEVVETRRQVFASSVMDSQGTLLTRQPFSTCVYSHFPITINMPLVHGAAVGTMYAFYAFEYSSSLCDNARLFCNAKQKARPPVFCLCRSPVDARHAQPRCNHSSPTLTSPLGQHILLMLLRSRMRASL